MLALGSPTSVRTSTTCGSMLRELEVSSLFFSLTWISSCFQKAGFSEGRNYQKLYVPSALLKRMHSLFLYIWLCAHICLLSYRFT